MRKVYTNTAIFSDSFLVDNKCLVSDTRTMFSTDCQRLEMRFGESLSSSHSIGDKHNRTITVNKLRFSTISVKDTSKNSTILGSDSWSERHVRLAVNRVVLDGIATLEMKLTVTISLIAGITRLCTNSTTEANNTDNDIYEG